MDDAKHCLRCGEQLVERFIDGRERLACSSASCDFVYWDNPTPVVAAIVEHEGNVVLVRNHGWPEKMYGLVTGFLEKDESPEDAVVREVREELGLEAEIAEFVGVYAFAAKNELIVAYHVRAAGSIELGEELAAVKPLPPGRVRAWPFGTGPALRDWLERRNADG